MKRKRKFHISSVNNYDHNCAWDEYLYLPVRHALNWFIRHCAEFNIDLIKCQQVDNQELYLTIKGKKKDIARIIVVFVSSNGEKFNIK